MTTNHHRRLDPAKVLFGADHRRLLGLLFMRPDESFHVREIARLTGVDAGNAHRALRRFEQAGLVTATRSGNQRLYQANRESPIYTELLGIVLKTAGLADVLRDALEPLAPSIECAFVFGSVARGDAGSRSDVDLMVVVRDSDETAVRRSQRALRCLQGLRIPKDVIVPTRAQVDRSKHLRASLFRQILTRGRKLYG